MVPRLTRSSVCLPAMWRLDRAGSYTHFRAPAPAQSQTFCRPEWRGAYPISVCEVIHVTRNMDQTWITETLGTIGLIQLIHLIHLFREKSVESVWIFSQLF